MKTLKEQCRCTTVSIPYKRMQVITIEANLEDKVHWHNIFTPICYTLQALGPSGMILGQDKSYYSNLKLEFGQCCQVYKNTGNDMTPRILGGIALRPKNDRGSYYFMSLDTGRRIHARQWTILHITKSVIWRVYQLDEMRVLIKWWM